MTDQSLLKKFVDHGDQAAFAELVSRHGGIVLATARRLAGNDADDVAQAVFVLLARKAAGLLRYQNLAGWLYETTRLCAANAGRQSRRRGAEILAAREAAMSDTKSTVNDSDLLEKLDDGLSRLPEKYRQVLLLRYFSELSVDETAARLGLTASAVMKRSTRGLSQLREYFRRRGTPAGADALASCMISQALKLTPGQHARLISASAGNWLGPASALALILKIAGAAAALVLLTFAGMQFAGVARNHPVVTVSPIAATTQKSAALAGDVFLQGQMHRPGVYSIALGGPISVEQIIACAGGPIDEKSWITLVRRSGGADSYLMKDVPWSFVMNGQTPDVYLEAGDLLSISTTAPIVPPQPFNATVQGVKQPGIYEASNRARNLTVKSLIDTGGGPETDGALVALVRGSGKTASIVFRNISWKSIAGGECPSVNLEPNDFVFVYASTWTDHSDPKNPPAQAPLIYVDGGVARSGAYTFAAERPMRVSQIISSAGGPTDVSASLDVIRRADGVRSYAMKDVPWQAIVAGETPDVALGAGDIVRVSSRKN